MNWLDVVALVLAFAVMVGFGYVMYRIFTSDNDERF